MKKSLLILTLVVGVSQIAAKKHANEEQKPLVSLQEMKFRAANW